MSGRIEQLENEILDSRTVVLALLGAVAGRVRDNECIAACRKLVQNLQARWEWSDGVANVALFKGVEPMPPNSTRADASLRGASTERNDTLSDVHESTSTGEVYYVALGRSPSVLVRCFHNSPQQAALQTLLDACFPSDYLLDNGYRGLVSVYETDPAGEPVGPPTRFDARLTIEILKEQSP